MLVPRLLIADVPQVFWLLIPRPFDAPSSHPGQWRPSHLGQRRASLILVNVPTLPAPLDWPLVGSCPPVYSSLEVSLLSGASDNDAHLTLGNAEPVSSWSTCQPSRLLLIDPWLGVAHQCILLLRCPCYQAPVKWNGPVVLSNHLRREVNVGLIDGGSRWWRHSVSTLGVSAKENSHVHMHGSRFYVSLSVMFSFLLSLAAFCSPVVVAIA